jgi:hypothetical protein
MFKNKLHLLLILLAHSSLNIVFSQRNVKDEAIGTPLLGINYGLNQPTKDLNDRFGVLNHLGFISGYKTKSNWVIGIEGNFIFGNQIKEDSLLQNLKDSYGNITDINGEIAVVPLFVRGFNTNFTIGKIIPIFSPNPNSGIFINTGVGFMAYKIRIESNNQVIPQIELNYKKGYDRLTSGLCTHQFLGYSYLSNSGFYNWYAGLYTQQGFTTNQREIFFDHPNSLVSKTIRKDFSYGFKLGWLIPIYKRKPKEFYFN